MIGQSYPQLPPAASRLPDRAGRDFQGVRPYRRRLQQLDRLRQPYREAWRVLNEFIHPWSGKYLVSDRERADVMVSANIRNPSVGDAARLCASALHGGLTSPAQPWFELTHPDSGLMEIPKVKTWLHGVQEAMRSVLAKSNFYSVIPGLYLEAVIYGSAAMIIDPDPAAGVRFRQLTVGEYWLGQSEDLRVDSLYRRLDLSAAALREKFGPDNPGFSEAVRAALARGDLDEPTFPVIHAMQPSGFLDGKPHPAFAYESVYFLDSPDDPETRTVLAWRGHRSQPFVAVRWATAADAVYGYAPGWAALPDDRLLQAMEEDYGLASEFALRPVLTGPAELEPDVREGLVPGGFIPHDAAGGRAPALTPLTPGKYDFLNIRNRIQDIEARVRSRFYNDLFVSLLFNDKRMTATEVAQRLEEKAMVIGPILERFQAELFDPILDRVFVIMFHEYGVLPPPPPVISGADLKVEYLGTLSQSARLVGLTNLTNSLPIVREVLAIDPAAAVKIDVKEIIDEVATKANWPVKAIRPDELCREMEEQAAKAQQEQAGAEQAAILAKAARDAGMTDPAAGGTDPAGGEAGGEAAAELDLEGMALA